MRDFHARHVPHSHRRLRRVAVHDGFVQQHVLTGVGPNGRAFSLPAMLRVRVRDGRIIRLDEYIDGKQVDALTA